MDIRIGVTNICITVEKVAQNLGYFYNFQKTAQSKQSPQVESSPNLVTLMDTALVCKTLLTEEKRGRFLTSLLEYKVSKPEYVVFYPGMQFWAVFTFYEPGMNPFISQFKSNKQCTICANFNVAVICLPKKPYTRGERFEPALLFHRRMR
jgi:hypothetical protein